MAGCGRLRLRLGLFWVECPNGWDGEKCPRTNRIEPKICFSRTQRLDREKGPSLKHLGTTVPTFPTFFKEYQRSKALYFCAACWRRGWEVGIFGKNVS